jgi:hypothetical protein
LQHKVIISSATMDALTLVNNARLLPQAAGGRIIGSSLEQGSWSGLFAENLMHEIAGVPGAELFSADWPDGNRRYAG